MFLRSLVIKNFRAIKAARFDFVGPTSQTRKWTLLLGENGAGKSTVLRAAAMLLAGPDALPRLLEDVDSWVKRGAKQATLEATLATKDGEARTAKLVIERGRSVDRVLAANRKNLERLRFALDHSYANYFVLGYGASRRMNIDPEACPEQEGPGPLPLGGHALLTRRAATVALGPWLPAAVGHSERVGRAAINPGAAAGSSAGAAGPVGHHRAAQAVCRAGPVLRPRRVEGASSDSALTVRLTGSRRSSGRRSALRW